MALISPGVEVTVTDESFYVPAAAPTIPLIVLATREQKKQPNGTSPAVGTFEHNQVRTVSSIVQSIQLYGTPYFHQTSAGEDMHGDARNEYGLLALNQYLGQGSRAYVVRANVNLNDDRLSILNIWLTKIAEVAAEVEVAITQFILQYNTANGLVSNAPGYKRTVTKAEFLLIAKESLKSVYNFYNFKSSLFKSDFESDHALDPLDIFNSTFTVVSGSFIGLEGEAQKWVATSAGATVGLETEFTASEAADLISDLADDFALTVEFLTSTGLGANDAARRVAIVTALQESLAHPQLRSEQYEYNIVMCPGFHETADDVNALVADVKREAFGICDTPMSMDPEQVVAWATNPASGRVFSADIAYYYSHPLSTNLDGREVLGAASGIVLRTIAYSDRNSAVWFAPAGIQRGTVSGASRMGYFTGVAGGATTFVESVMNEGQRDALYSDIAKINPITFMPGRGIIVNGQKTSAGATSALDRINVVRLLCMMRRNLRKSAFAFVFEPNDRHTRDNLKAMVDNFLRDIMIRRGLYDYVVVCDESNNTPARIDRNELIVDIAIKPVKAAEFIYIPIRVVNTGADL